MKKKNWKAWVALALGVADMALDFVHATWAWYITPFIIIPGLILIILARKDPATKKRRFTKFCLIFYGIILMLDAFAAYGWFFYIIDKR